MSKRQNIYVLGWDMNGNRTLEEARAIKPADVAGVPGYWLVQFDADKARLLVHESGFVAREAA